MLAGYRDLREQMGWDEVEMERHAGTIINDVVIGKGGHLFLASGGHHILDYATGSRKVSAFTVETFWGNIAHRVALCDKLCNYIHIIVPDKQSILSDFYIVDNPVRLGDVCLQSESSVTGRVIYPKELLSERGPSVYLKTDTHLSDEGTVSVAAEVLSRVTDLDLADIFHSYSQLSTNDREHCGDLGSKLTPTLSSIERFRGMDWAPTFFTNNMTAGNNGMIDVYFSANSLKPWRLLLFGDSFGREMAKFFSLFCREVLFLRTPFFHQEIFEAMRPDIVVSECAERYLENCPDDGNRPFFFMYPFFSQAPYNPSSEFAHALSAVLSYGREPYARYMASRAKPL